MIRGRSAAVQLTAALRTFGDRTALTCRRNDRATFSKNLLRSALAMRIIPSIHFSPGWGTLSALHGPGVGWIRLAGESFPSITFCRRAGMNELVTTETDWFLDEWDGSPMDEEDPRDQVYEYIVDPEPLPDSHFDEGGCD
jgi:hypothetical protein